MTHYFLLPFSHSPLRASFASFVSLAIIFNLPKYESRYKSTADIEPATMSAEQQKRNAKSTTKDKERLRWSVSVGVGLCCVWLTYVHITHYEVWFAPSCIAFPLHLLRLCLLLHLLRFSLTLFSSKFSHCFFSVSFGIPLHVHLFSRYSFSLSFIHSISIGRKKRQKLARRGRNTEKAKGTTIQKRARNKNRNWRQMHLTDSF